MTHQNRTYRGLIRKDKLTSFTVIVKETDIAVQTAIHLEDMTRDLVYRYRGHIESYINRYPEFARTLAPWFLNEPAPLIIQDMASASMKTGVGPMAAVAGAIAEHVGKSLLPYSDEVIVENGGDIFIKIKETAIVGIYAGRSPLSLKIGLKVDPQGEPISICTSSGTIGHSLSFGKADAVCTVARSCSLADAAATSICNKMKTNNDIRKAIDFGKDIEGIMGIVIIMNDKVGAWGDIDVVPLKGKKG